jgi:DNA-binding PadR family transcriptional regulator
MSRRLTTTSHAVLGLLATGATSAYDLTQQFQRAMRWAWPTSLTHLYGEPKKLVAEGLVRAHQAPAGPRRTRTEYRITAAGRRALARWLATPPAGPELNNEGMLRVVFADAGSRDDLLAALDHLDEVVWQQYREGLDQVGGYLRDGGPVPNRLHLMALASDYHARFMETYLDWIADARAEALRWPGTKDVGMTPAGRAVLEGILRRARRRMESRD